MLIEYRSYCVALDCLLAHHIHDDAQRRTLQPASATGHAYPPRARRCRPDGSADVVDSHARAACGAGLRQVRLLARRLSRVQSRSIAIVQACNTVRAADFMVWFVLRCVAAPVGMMGMIKVVAATA